MDRTKASLAGPNPPQWCPLTGVRRPLLVLVRLRLLLSRRPRMAVTEGDVTGAELPPLT
jgi:hypothetical protein